MKRILCMTLTWAILLLTGLPGKASGECSAKAAIVIEAASGTVLYEKNVDEPLPEASTTKIMTALLVLELAAPEQRIKISPAAASVEGSQLGLKEGDELSISDLLYALMMKSGNDAAVALAEGVCGSETKFVDKMNEKAQSLGLNNTQFRNPHGLPAEGHYTTARDLANLTATALENSEFCKLVSTQRARLEYKNMILSNSNKLLYTGQGVFGVKTGFTKKAGRCLVTAAERKGVKLICVTLNAPNDWADHTMLYDTCFQRVSRCEIVPQGGHSCIVPVLGGDQNAVLKNTLPLSCVTIDGIPVEYKLQEHTVPRIFAPVEKSKTLGYLCLISNTGRILSSSPMNTVIAVEQKKEERTFKGSFPLKLRKMWRTLTSGIAS